MLLTDALLINGKQLVAYKGTVRDATSTREDTGVIKEKVRERLCWSQRQLFREVAALISLVNNLPCRPCSLNAPDCHATYLHNVTAGVRQLGFTRDRARRSSSWQTWETQAVLPPDLAGLHSCSWDGSRELQCQAKRSGVSQFIIRAGGYLPSYLALVPFISKP